VPAASRAAACLFATLAIGGCASSSNRALSDGSVSISPLGHGSLSDREFNVAVAVARAEVAKAATGITNATATVGAGTDMDPNDGPPCTSGTLLHIKLIGTFNIITTGYGGQPTPVSEPVSGVLITADPVSGKACTLGVQTGPIAPDPGATLLFISSEPASSEPASSQPAALAPAASSVSPSSSVTAPSLAGASPDPAVEKRLWALAVSAAAAEGGTVKAAQAVGSTHARAVAVTMSDGVEGDQPVWVVQIEGVTEFVCDQCSVPEGASAPHGRFQLLIVDAETFRTLDFGLQSTETDLTKLGPVVGLHP
jgi:hypothetical protein